MIINSLSNNVVEKLEQTVRYEKKQVQVLRVSKSSSNVHAYMIFPEFSEVKISNTELDEYIENLSKCKNKKEKTKNIIMPESTMPCGTAANKSPIAVGVPLICW